MLTMQNIQHLQITSAACKRTFFHCYKKAQNNTLCFRCTLLPCSGETTNPKTKTDQKCSTHINLIVFQCQWYRQKKKAVCFRDAVCCFEYNCDNQESSCKCCWYYSCTTTVRSPHVTITTLLKFIGPCIILIVE